MLTLVRQSDSCHDFILSSDIPNCSGNLIPTAGPTALSQVVRYKVASLNRENKSIPITGIY